MDFGLNITLLQWNIQGYINHKYALELLVSRHKPNIIALQETHIIGKNLHMLHLPGYKIYHHNKDYEYAKSGIALLIQNNINVTQHTTSTGDLLFQSVIISCGSDLQITNIYKEHDSNLTTSIVNNIYLSNNAHHLLLGDLNSQNVLWGSASNSPNGNIWETFADDKGFVILNDGSPTLLSTRHTLTSVDVSMASVDFAPGLVWTCLPMPEVGDHFPIKITNKIEVVKKQFSSRFKDKKADWSRFEKKSLEVMQSFEKSPNINKEAAQIKRILRKTANETIPQSRRPPIKNNPVWFNSEIAKLLQIKQQAWKLFKRHRSQSNGIEYRRACAKFKRESKSAKRLTWENFLNSLNPTMDVRFLWKKVNNLRADRQNNFPAICINNQNISHPKEIADNFADFWCSLSSDGAFDSEIVETKKNLDIDNLPQSSQQYRFLYGKITIFELNDTLKTLKGSTPARDKITYSMVKNAPISLKSRLCELYNKILENGVFPQDWKTAILSPIPKPGKSPNQLEGYRPISLLPVLSKIFEKILAKRFWKHTRENISKMQHAFIPRHGVHSICHQLEETLRRNLKNRKHSLVLSEDIEKAFDRVISTYIILELNEWGIPKEILRLIKSFLDNRKVIVKVDGYFSSTYPLDNGVPQGSPLSVVLYTIYANSLAKAIENLPGIDYVGIYADNIFAIASGKSEVVRTNLNNLDLKVQNWAKSRGAVVPAEKTEILHVCRKTECISNTIRIRNFDLQIEEQMRILGIYFSRNLLWNFHVKHLTTKLSKINNLLRLICSRNKGPHIETAINICRSLTVGVLLHGITIYGWTSKANIAKLNTSINNCFRTASGLLRPTPIPLLRLEANFMDVQSLFEKSCVSLASRSITITSDGLHDTFWKNLNNTSNKRTSSIKDITLFLKENKISLPSKPITNNSAGAIVTVDDSLSIFNKNSTDPICFKKMLAEKMSSYSPTMTLYTDGSYHNGVTSFSIVNQISTSRFEVVHVARLPDHTGIFTAEVAAINSAISFSARNPGRTLICTDSLSATRALRKNLNGLYDDLLNQSPNNQIFILWIPSHIGIQGNESADGAARDALNLNEITETPCFPKVISNPFRNIQRQQNTSVNRPHYNNNLSRSKCVMLARLRVGKCVFNTKHYYEKTDPLKCSSCDVILTVPHILVECPISKIDEPLEKLLECSVDNNIPKLQRSLLKHNIQNV